MYYFITASRSSYITEDSPSHIVQYPNSVYKNYGGDEILELKKEFVNSYSTASYGVSRILTAFDYSVISASIVDGTIPKPEQPSYNVYSNSGTGSMFYLRLYEVEGQKELDKTYNVITHTITTQAAQWEEGVGKKFDEPKVEKGVTWTDLNSGSAWTTIGASYTSGSRFSSTGGGVWWAIAPSVNQTSQSFENQSPDIEMDMTHMVRRHIQEDVPNYGFITKFSGSYEDDETQLDLKFFSNNTNTIYQPKLEVRWNDISYPDSITGSINYITMSGEIENHIFIKGLQPTYRESEKVRFRVGCRKKYTQKTFTESMLTSSFYAPPGRCLYSIVDSSTGEYVIP